MINLNNPDKKWIIRIITLVFILLAFIAISNTVLWNVHSNITERETNEKILSLESEFKTQIQTLNDSLTAKTARERLEWEKKQLILNKHDQKMIIISNYSLEQHAKQLDSTITKVSLYKRR